LKDNRNGLHRQSSERLIELQYRQYQMHNQVYSPNNFLKITIAASLLPHFDIADSQATDIQKDTPQPQPGLLYCANLEGFLRDLS